MRRPVIGLSLTLTLLSGSLRSTAAVQATAADLEGLLQKLQDEASSNQATDELLKRGKADAKTLKYLADHLPRLLEQYQPTGDVIKLAWGNEARLAGELKIAEAVPALCKRIDMLTSPKRGGSLGYNFLDREAVNSLILIGPASVPAVVDVLKHGTAIQREEAAYVLGEIGTDRAREALTDALEEETHRAVRQRIEEALKRPSRSFVE
jgi:HEAT repeat protein